MESVDKTEASPLMERSETLGSSECKAKPMDTEITPTDYQLKVYDVAMRRNTIAVLENGDENYTIALMMIKEIGKSLKNNDGDKRLIAFLVPTVHLVHEQYKELKSQTELDVGEYYGALGVDDWNNENWEKEINEHNVMVMTPQILLDALRKTYLSFEVFCFIVLDECHRATGNHPYARIMKDFYLKSPRRPKIFGMTAPPMIRKGSTEQISVLESVLDSQVYTVEDRVELEEQIHIPFVETKYKFYDRIQPSNLEVKEKLESTWAKFDAVLLGLQKLLPSQHKDTDDKYNALLDRFAKDHTNIMFCLENLGLLCGYEAVKICMENSPKVHEECELYKESLVHYKIFLQEVLSIIEGSQQNKKLLNSGSDAVAAGQITSKLQELLETFRSFGKDTEVLCLVFVEKIIASEVIERVMKKITDFYHFNISHMTRSNSSEVLESFCGGKVNLLFSTDVLEEGTHLIKFSSVIHFDLPKTLRSYVQLKGRVCPKNSQYFIMLERANTKQMDHMLHLSRSERSALKRDSNDSLLKACNTNEVLPYVVDLTGASVAVNSSISLIQRYCDKLPRDNNFTPKPRFEPLMEGNLYRCKLILPPNAAFQTTIGPVACNFHVSKQLVCLEACKKLHQMRALSDHLLPLNKESSQKNSTLNKKALSSGAGTTRRKELHGSIGVHILSGTWGELEDVIFYAYKMNFSCNIAEQKYSSFALLLERKLDDDVGNIEVDLYLRKKKVRASISSCGQIHLSSQQVVKAKCFQELIFTGLFGKLFFKSSGVRQFLLQTEESFWDSSNMYLLLPLESEDISTEPPSKINWAGIDSCVSTVEFLKKNARLNSQQSETIDGNTSARLSETIIGNSSARVSDPAKNKFNSDIIHLADRSTSVESLKEMVVVAIHTGKIYSVLDIVENTSAESPFEANADESYSSYANYFLKKYGIALKHPQQPLLLLKQSHNSHNLLVDFRNAGVPLSKKRGIGKTVVEEKPLYRAHIPPELLVGTDITTYVLKSFYLLPSIMHRHESLMLASQLKEEISRDTGYCNISSSLILEALTTQRCHESFSMERLELLGDSVLKYAVSCHLYLKNPMKHEGQLSSSRSRIICNSTLHKLGTDRKLQEYVQDCPFDSRRWTAPGQRSIWPSPCSHGLDTREVPLESRFFSEDIKLMLGKTCDRGHRWMVSKTISDCVEALIGAYHVAGGLPAAVSLMKWLGIEVEVEHSLIDDAIKVASLYSYAPKAKDIGILESKLGYNFSTKGLLLEAITHEAEHEEGVGYCYQRLEFLGDAVLDVLITCHLYENHRDVDPGELTDLRSASVNNDNFALASVRRNLHPHLQHSSVYLEHQISTFVESVSGMSTTTLAPDVKGPKVLGDLVESIAGAVLIDSKLNLDVVWKVFKPILSPIVTPDKLDLAPSRELTELCDSLGYFIKESFPKEGDVVHAELKLQLKDVLLHGRGSGPNNKAAKGMAALQLLEELKKRGIKSFKRRIVESDDADSSRPDDKRRQSETCGSAPKRRKSIQEGDVTPKECSKTDIPVVPPIEMKKGGPRTSLYSLCKKLQWPLPAFDTKEQKSRTPIEFVDGTTGFCGFESQISLTIPDFGQLEVMGEARGDKKSSFDSAALVMLYELERRGKILIAK